MIDQTKFNEHVKCLLTLADILATVNKEPEAMEYLDRLLAAALAELKVGVKHSG